jgi:hypothetical protein
MQLKNQQYNEMPSSVHYGVTTKRMGGRGPAKPLHNGSGMGNGFNYRIRVLDGIARPVLAISSTGVER